ncbi:MAG: polysaccharide export protein [Planctomycetes bacterium]|nr:polysaccharide export protein [Planctomycetota bacterium]
MSAIARAAALLACVILSAGCQTFHDPPVEAEPAPFEFRFGPGDRIHVSVWGEKELQLDLQLGPDGSIAIPLVGDVQMGGLTIDEARVELAKRLKAAYVDPTVSVSLVEMRSHVIHVAGEVANPGTVAYVRGATVLAAIQASGGVKEGIADLSAVRVIRTRTFKPAAYELDLEAVLAGERPDMWLLPGDTIYVPVRLLARWNRWWRLFWPWSDSLEAPK